MLAILTYHSLDSSGSVISVAPRAFADHMACLADQGLRAMSLRAAVDHRAAHAAWPARSVVLTFDDGYANCVDVALPILLRHGFTATVFVVSGHMGGRNDWAPPPAGLGTQGILSWQQAATLAASGVEIGSHTRHHFDLRLLPAEQAAEEIVSSRLEISEHLNTTVESFAYPFGQRAWPAIVQREFRAACTTVLRRAADDALHSLPRIDMYYIRSMRTLSRLVHGQLDQWLRVRNWGRSVRGALQGWGYPTPAGL